MEAAVAGMMTISSPSPSRRRMAVPAGVTRTWSLWMAWPTTSRWLANTRWYVRPRTILAGAASAVLGPKVASVNQAVATRIGGQRVTITMLNGTAVMRVDEKVISGELPKLKAGSLTGGTTAYGGTRQLTWPDGTVVRVEQLGRYALNVKVTPAASRRGSLEGLLGQRRWLAGQ